jgi:hypothetical protein
MRTLSRENGWIRASYVPFMRTLSRENRRIRASCAFHEDPIQREHAISDFMGWRGNRPVSPHLSFSIENAYYFDLLTLQHGMLPLLFFKYF